jgi:hypothetical protein
LHSPDGVAFVSPGWEDLSRSLPTLGEGDEQTFLGILLEELNQKFALRLDPNPSTDWTSQYATDNQHENLQCIVLAGSSHSSRLIDPLESTHFTVVDSTMAGFRITENSVAEMTADVKEKIAELDPLNTVVLIQLLDNSIYQCTLPNGDKVLPKKGRDGKYHAEGELHVVNRDTVRELFSTLQPIFRAVREFKTILLTPLPRYLWSRCCSNPLHITNSEAPGYAASMGSALRDLNKCLRNMIFMRKLKGVYTLNSMEALGLIPPMTSDHTEDEERVIALWGPDPVHPTSAAYRELAAKIAEKASEILAEKSAQEEQSVLTKRKAEPRDPWIERSQAIAKRLDDRGTVRGSGRGGGSASTRGPGSRGARPPHRPFRGRGWWHRGQRRGN